MIDLNDTNLPRIPSKCRVTLLETANERGSLVKLPGIEAQAAAFARHIAES